MILRIDPKASVIAINSLSLLVLLIMIIQSRNHIKYKEIFLPIVAGVVGVPIGLYVIGSLNQSILSLLISVLVVFLGLCFI